MKDNIILEKSFEFAVRVVNLYKHLSKDKREYVLSKQLIRSGTSIGANINEAQAAQSKKDFIAKMAIASKEARESKYWIDLLIKTDYLNSNDNHTKSLLSEIEEIIKLLTSIVKTGQNKQ
ncbi:MAG: four helix bundle protein [Candidatus Thioglobus sp.]|uniref:four helix bundle protein n=1 Tax=Candidatus Thioglobus sp. TaxID=2026721 RepID=UPI00263393E5|nr:four helix bundle protein [Candidatus Thioglobus sp.]MDC9727276.1 four helix bundle protein [Candidatus Thioglobus sp.]